MKTKKYRVNGKLKNQKPKGNSRKTSKNLTKLKCKKKEKNRQTDVHQECGGVFRKKTREKIVCNVQF